MSVLFPAVSARDSSQTRSWIRPLLSLLLLLAMVWVPALQAQESGEKKALSIAEYQLWRSISGAQISQNGEWVSWTYSFMRGDDTLHVVNPGTDAEHVVPFASGAEFSDDGSWVAYFVSLSFKEAEKARDNDDPVLRKAELMNLASGETLTWDDASSFGFADGSSHFYVKKRKKDRSADHDGTDLILRNLRQGYDELIGSVDQLGFNKAGTSLAYTVDAADKDGNGLYLVDLGTSSRRALDNAKERYSQMTWSEEGAALAVLRGETPDEKTERENTLVAFTEMGSANPSPHVFGPESGEGLPEGLVISENAGLDWSEGLGTIFVGTKAQEDEVEDWPDDGLPLADVNIWHWADDRIQSVQQSQVSRDRNRTYLAAIHLETGRMVPLADEGMRTVNTTRDGQWGMGQDDREYVSDWKPSYADYYRIDIRTGERTEVLKKHLRTMGLSPDSEHFLYWLDGQVWVYRIADDQHVNLTASAPVDFADQEFDHPGERPPYGVTGWTKDGEAVLLNHRYDIWFQPLDGSPATNLTLGQGDENETRFSYVRTDPEARFIDLEEPILLSGYGQWTKKTGFYELEDGELRELAWEDRRFGRAEKAEDADRFLFTVQTFQEFPDLWVSDGDFSGRERITDANPQQDEYLWGHRILFDFTNDDGVRLQGTLGIPDSYVEGQKLPMLVTFYEKMSQNLHSYPTPGHRSSPNLAGYVSNEYLVMQPDVHFRTGSSHTDMLECVEAAIRKVIEMGYVDPERVGLHGHSYSGGGGAFLATRSKMFAAVAHGAAPINLVSEFNQLWKGGGQNNHGYDVYGQGRYGTNPYDDFQLYWDQSPISGLETMNTPVLYLHGESDGTVNWEQGLEWYNGLRFLGKPIIWLSYPDEGHGLGKMENRVDFQYRMRQFFDHYLKGASAPKWMTDGVSQVDKDGHLREFAPRIFTPPDTTGGGG